MGTDQWTQHDDLGTEIRYAMKVVVLKSSNKM